MSKPIFSYSSYKEIINDLVAGSPNGGRGAYRRMAQHLRISSVTISQIFRGDRDLSVEQGLLLTDFWGFSECESKYFLLMIQSEKSSHAKYKEFCRREMSLLKEEMAEIKSRVPKSKDISEKDKSIFYSHWKYSAVRLCTDIDGKHLPISIAQMLGLSVQETKRILEFLVENSLVLKTNSGYRIGPQTTHLSSESPWLRQHHRNWRTKALEGLEALDRSELSYTAPMAVSEGSLLEIRELLLESIERIVPIIRGSQSEKLACLNIDLFKFPKS